MALFKDRYDAGRKLSTALQTYRADDAIVHALPRGGVPVAYEVSKNLNIPMDIFIVRKIGVPEQEELAMGAIASGGVRVLNQNVIKILNIPDDVIEDAALKERDELNRREKIYRNNRSFPSVVNKTAILIDDGLATGASMRAAVKALRNLHPAKIVVAVPTASEDTCNEFKSEVDQVICVYTPAVFRGVGEWYDNFSQTTDEEVLDLMDEIYRTKTEDKK